MGLQIPYSMDNKISIRRVERRRRIPVPGAAARDSDEQRDEDLCRSYKPGSCSYANRDTTKHVSFQSRTISEREKLSQTVERIQTVKEAILGATFVGERILGGNKRECDG